MVIAPARMLLWAASLSALAAATALAAARTREQRHAGLLAAALLGGYVLVSLGSFALQARIAPSLRYPWLGKTVIALAVPLAGWTRLAPSLRAMGMKTMPARRDWLATLAGFALCIGVAWFDPSIPGDPRSLECAAFEAMMPGLDEELFFRGWMLAVLDRAFGTAWRFAGARVGWGFVVVCVVFVAGHVFSIDASLRPRIATAPLPALSLLGFGLCCTWLRSRTGSVWSAVFAHNAANSVLVAYSRLR